MPKQITQEILNELCEPLRLLAAAIRNGERIKTAADEITDLIDGLGYRRREPLEFSEDVPTSTCAELNELWLALDSFEFISGHATKIRKHVYLKTLEQLTENGGERREGGEPILNGLQIEAMKLLFKLGAFSSDSRISTEKLAKESDRNADPTKFKRPCTKLKRLRYLDSDLGPGGGYWLTGIGRRRAEKMNVPN